MEAKEDSILKTLINKLPIEFHLPGYNYCGPGTKLSKRLARGDKGINELDDYCKQHDIAYNKYSDLNHRHQADIKLLKMARTRMSAKNATVGEKIAANIVNKTMLAKVNCGAGIKKNFKNVVTHTKKRIQKMKPKCKKMAMELAFAAAKELVSNSPVQLPRVIPIPKTGGVLPLIPIFAGLSAIGGLSGGVAGIAKAYNEFKAAKRRLIELKRHNEKMESLCVGKGLQLKPYKDGLAIYVSNQKN